jgi:isoleucyl-tRNA synthetase
VLPFTAEEVWAFMPEVANKPKSIHLAPFPKADPALMDEDLARRWEMIIRVRGEVTRVLETARAEKQIGHSLDASVTLAVSKTLYDVLAAYEPDLRSIFIVSEVNLMQDENTAGAVQTEVEGLWVKALPAPGEKCQRCWIYDTSVNLEADGGGVCTRCRSVLDSIIKP